MGHPEENWTAIEQSVTPASFSSFSSMKPLMTACGRARQYSTTELGGRTARSLWFRHTLPPLTRKGWGFPHHLPRSWVSCRMAAEIHSLEVGLYCGQSGG